MDFQGVKRVFIEARVTYFMKHKFFNDIFVFIVRGFTTFTCLQWKYYVLKIPQIEDFLECPNVSNLKLSQPLK
jgi:hypothetical protein